MNKPIWNTDIPGYPCYVCALSSAGVPCPSSNFVTASTTSCISPPPSYTPPPPVVIPCSTCLPYTLSTCPAYTVPPSSSVYIVTAPTVIPHVHSQATSVPAATVQTTAAVAPIASATVKASSTALTFTGSAGRAEAKMMALGGAIMVAALAL